MMRSNEVVDVVVKALNGSVIANVFICKYFFYQHQLLIVSRGTFRKFMRAKSTYVKEAKVQCPIQQKRADGEHEIGGLFERVDIDEGTSRLRSHKPRLQQEVQKDHRSQDDEPQAPDRPGEANRGHQVLDYGRERHAPGSGPRGGERQRERPPLLEVRVDDGRARHPDQAEAGPGAHALREEDLPVLRGQARHEDAERHEGGSRQHGLAHEAGVREAAADHARAVVDEDLHRPDPGDRRRRQPQRRGVVQLEDPEDGGQARRHDVAQVAG